MWHCAFGQALLANMGAMYAVYHGPEGVTTIANSVFLIKAKQKIDEHRSVAGHYCNKLFNEGHEQQDRPLSRKCHTGAVQNHRWWPIRPN